MENLKKELEDEKNKEFDSILTYEEKEEIEKEIAKLKEQILEETEEKVINIQEIIEEKEKQLEKHKRFQVDNLNKANWVLGKIANLELEKNRLEEFLEQEVEQITNFVEKRNKVIEQNIEHFTIMLKTYIDNERENVDPKFSIKTPNGTVNYGKIQKKMVYNDDVILKFCKDNGYDNLINLKVSESLKKNDFKKMVEITNDNKVVFKEDGLIIEDIEIQETQKLNIKTKVSGKGKK